jgi:hypothetical protein
MTLDTASAERFANMALACIHREYPNKLGHHMLNSDADVKPPRELTPAFYGCYDWHSAVHGHWLLARLARLFPEAEFTPRARAALAKSLTAENLRREAEYIQGDGRASFERPYGLAWLLQLSTELDGGLPPLEEIVVARLTSWLAKLSHPVRTGEHNQTAFSLALMLDYARIRQRTDFEAFLVSRVRAFYWNDRNTPIAYEPSGEDFLSPSLGEADVVRRVADPDEFAAWLTGFLPSLPEPVEPTDRGDPKLGHLDGLNLSRAWMLEGIRHGLPASDPRIPSLEQAVERHARAGLDAVTDERYEGAHWLGTFAVYLTTRCGVRR